MLKHIELHNLTLGYDRHPAVHHINCTIAQGAALAIVGPNGAGKSTLLKALAGELPPIQGQIRCPLQKSQIAYLAQKNETDTGFPINVFDFIAMGLWRQMGAFGGLTQAQQQMINNTIMTAGLQGLENRAIGALSGGQIQRARFARMSLQNAQLLLLDEPFNAIDSRTSEDLLQHIQGWQQEGRTVIAVLHDLRQVRAYFPRCLLIARELVAYGDTAQVLSDKNLAQASRQAAVFDDHAPVCERTEMG